MSDGVRRCKAQLLGVPLLLLRALAAGRRRLLRRSGALQLGEINPANVVGVL